jgi:hypothetical protein
MGSSYRSYHLFNNDSCKKNKREGNIVVEYWTITTYLIKEVVVGTHYPTLPYLLFKHLFLKARSNIFLKKTNW